MGENILGAMNPNKVRMLLTFFDSMLFYFRKGGAEMITQNSCGAMIKQIHDELEKQANNALRPQDLTMAQVGVLLTLNEADGRQFSLKDLEQIFHVAQSTAAGIVSRLEQKGLVEPFGDPEDKRIKKIRITPKGVERCREAEMQMIQTEARILSGLTETEQTIFLTLLQKVRDSLV